MVVLRGIFDPRVDIRLQALNTPDDVYSKQQIRYFLYGVACGAAAHSAVKIAFDRENFQPHDVVVPAVVTTLSLGGIWAMQEREHGE